MKSPVQSRSVAQSCPSLCDPMDRSTPGLPVHHQLPESTQTHVHWVGDAIQPFILCRPLLLLPSVFPSIRVFSNESAPRIRWPKYWSFSFSISLSNEHSGLISFGHMHGRGPFPWELTRCHMDTLTSLPTSFLLFKKLTWGRGGGRLPRRVNTDLKQSRLLKNHSSNRNWVKEFLAKRWELAKRWKLESWLPKKTWHLAYLRINSKKFNRIFFEARQHYGFSGP